MYPLTLDLVERMRREHFGDERTTVGEVQVVQGHEGLHLQGEVLERHEAEAFMAALRHHSPGINWRDELVPLVAGPEYGWALVPHSVRDLRREPSMRSERISQVVFGEAVEVLRCKGDWAFVRMADGYLGWMHERGLWRCTAAEADAWLHQATHVVTRATLPYYASAAGQPEHQVGLLPFGATVPVEDEHGPFCQVRLPNQTVRWMPTAGLVSLKQRPPATPAGLQVVMGWIETMIGVPYLWGGRTSFGYDCSGLVQTIYALVGVALPRDADQQAVTGTAVPFEGVGYGDLLFFDTRLPDAELDTASPCSITHVALALHAGDFLHASSVHGGLVYGSLNKRSPRFLPNYRERLIAARRLIPHVAA